MRHSVTIAFNKMKMKHLAILALAAISFNFSVAAQPSQISRGAAPARSEIMSFDTRRNANDDNRTNVQHYVPFAPIALTRTATLQSVGQVLEVPQIWNNRDMYLHIENPHGAYSVYVNDSLVGRSTDTRTPMEFYISPYVNHGQNGIVIEVETSDEPLLSSSLDANARAQFENSYIYSQPKLRIYDYDVRFEPDSTRTFGWLELNIIAGNSHNYTETMEVGYDLTDPAGKLQDYNMRECSIEGRSVDTVRFRMPIYKTNQWLWSQKTPHLYKLTMYSKLGQMMTDYIPIKLCFGDTRFDGERLLRNGKEFKIKGARYNAEKSRTQTLKDLRALKARGVNTIYVDYPQAYWFYNQCEQVGLFVVDQANLNVERGRDQRTIGGTPTNDPTLVDEYIDRVRRMYLRNRNRSCIIAWSLGGNSGNGYNMYKAYQWLKAQGDERPIVYRDADGEWNSDWLLPAEIQ